MINYYLRADSKELFYSELATAGLVDSDGNIRKTKGACIVEFGKLFVRSHDETEADTAIEGYHANMVSNIGDLGLTNLIINVTNPVVRFA